MCNSRNQQGLTIREIHGRSRLACCYVCPNEYFTLMEAADTVIDDLFFLFCTHLSFLSSENANEEDKKEFMDEIELMKKVGKHQNVLSFFGCWTTTKPILLMVEYIAHGDLLHWLRHKRAQVNTN